MIRIYTGLFVFLLMAAQGAAAQQTNCHVDAFGGVEISAGQWREIENTAGIVVTQPVRANLTDRLCSAASELAAQKSRPVDGIADNFGNVMVSYLQGFAEDSNTTPPIEALLYKSYGFDWLNPFKPEKYGTVNVVNDMPLDIVVIRGDPQTYNAQYLVTSGPAKFQGKSSGNLVCEDEVEVIAQAEREFRCVP